MAAMPSQKCQKPCPKPVCLAGPKVSRGVGQLNSRKGSLPEELTTASCCSISPPRECTTAHEASARRTVEGRPHGASLRGIDALLRPLPRQQQQYQSQHQHRHHSGSSSRISSLPAQDQEGDHFQDSGLRATNVGDAGSTEQEMPRVMLTQALTQRLLADLFGALHSTEDSVKTVREQVCRCWGFESATEMMLCIDGQANASYACKPLQRAP